MSNLSNIGFPISSQEELYRLIDQVYSLGQSISVRDGRYVRYLDSCGAELWLQLKGKKEFLGFNPHFEGKSRRTVCLMKEIPRPESTLDGAFYAWANPQDPQNPESGDYPFVFDTPNARTFEGISLPQSVTIQLAAFAHELHLYDSEEKFYQQQGAIKYSAQHFIPAGLFEKDSKAQASFAGTVKEWKKEDNLFSDGEFYWLLVDTLGGEVDVVADLMLIEQEPKVGSILHGYFWLSGKIVTSPLVKSSKIKKRFWSQWFSKK